MNLRGSGGWLQQGLATTVGALLLILSGGLASAQTPIGARLSIASSNTDRTQYPAIRLPDGSITGYGYDSCRVTPGLQLKLEVWFVGQTEADRIDVSLSPNTSFSSNPDRRVSGARLASIFYFDLNDGIAGREVTFQGSYTDGTVTVSDSFTIKMELFQAPSFYDAGRSQQKILQAIDALALAVNSRFTDPEVQARLREIRLFVSLWWSGRLAVPVQALGNQLVRLGAPRAFLIQLSRLMLDMQNAGLIDIHAGGNGFAELSFVFAHPPWLPLPQFLLVSCGPITVSWYGLGR